MFKLLESKDFVNQIMQRGIYSKYPHEEQKSILESEIKKARKGNVRSLNFVYSKTKTGQISKEDYTSIRKEFDICSS